MQKFNVIIEDVNRREFIPYNVIPYLVRQYKEAKNKPTTFEEFKSFIEKESTYQGGSRCEYEIILKEWPTGKKEEKIDVHWQVMMNIDVITKLLMDEINETES